MWDKNKLKGTGRTTRMLQEAAEAAKKDLVFVVAASDTHSVTLRGMLQALGIDRPSQIQIILPHQIDWRYMGVPGRNNEVFVDHWVIEKKYCLILDMLHLWDLP